MQPSWTDTLAEFLKQEPGVEAVRLDPGARKVAIATLGVVDLKQLEERLAETLAAIESQLGHAQNATAPMGFTLKRDGGVTEFSEVSCATAPKFWKWREVEWPELAPVVDVHAEESEWKELTLLASLCAVFGIAGFVTARIDAAP